MLVWPGPAAVDRAAREWAAEQAPRHPGLRRLGYFGSYARGDWGVGSDLDLVAIVDRSDLPFIDRGLAWDLDRLPVPAEMLVYTGHEWQRLLDEGSGFVRQLAADAVWIWPLDR